MAQQHVLQDLQNILRMTITQTHLALDESGTAIDELSSAFLSMANEVEALKQLVEQSDGLAKTTASTLLQAIIPYRQHMTQATVAFQFYDKFSQNMNHLITTLAEFEVMVGEDGIEDPAQWQALKDSVRARYTMEQEHRMLDAIEAGASPEEAVALASVASDNDIELF